MLDKARRPDKEETLQRYVQDMVSVALRQAQVSNGLDLRVGDHGNLAVSASGSVRGLQAMANRCHKSASEAWKLQWASMVQSRTLTTEWESLQLPLVELVTFAFNVAKARRRAEKHAWAGKASAFLQDVRAGVISLLAAAMLRAVVSHMRVYDCYNAPVPSRQLPSSSSRQDARVNLTFENCHLPFQLPVADC